MNPHSSKPPFFKAPGFIPYITLGDPSIEYTEKLIEYFIQKGAALIEIGVPFSDPIADGPVIQASHFRALTHNPTISCQDAFQLVQRFRSKTTIPFVLMLSANLVHHYGIETFFKDASNANVSGVILPDVPIEEEAPYMTFAAQYDVKIIRLLSYLTTGERFNRIVESADGFLYLISSTGTTGERATFNSELDCVVKSIKQRRPDLLVSIGFGISTNAQIRHVQTIADGAIVGSAIIKRIESSNFSPNFDSIFSDLF